MRTWFLFGLGASALYGLSAVAFKFLTEPRFLHGRPGWVLAGTGLGIALCGLLSILFWPSATPDSTTTRALLWAIPLGLMNGLATLFVLKALTDPATNLSQIVPVYNTNTLVAFVLAVVIFKELPNPADLYRNLIGALLIVAGTTLIGAK